MPVKPTLVSYTEVPWNTAVSGSKTSASVSWQAGDIIVVMAASEADSAISGPTATGLTFSKVVSNNNTGTCETKVSSATAAENGSSTVSMSTTSSAQHWGFGIWVFRDSLGIGQSAEQHSTTKTKSLNAEAEHSAIVYGIFDFSAAATITVVPTATDVRQAVRDTGRYTYYVNDLTDQPSTGAVSYGLSGTSSGPFSIVVVEVKGSLNYSGTEASNLTKLSLSAAGISGKQGTAAPVIKKVSPALAGKKGLQGASASDLQGMQLSVSGRQVYSGAAEPALSGIAIAGSGQVWRMGTVAVDIGPVSPHADDSFWPASGEIVGSTDRGSTWTLSDVGYMTLEGWITITGSIGILLKNPGLNGGGTYMSTGVVAFDLLKTSTTGAGKDGQQGTGTPSLTFLLASAAGRDGQQGTANPSIHKITVPVVGLWYVPPSGGVGEPEDALSVNAQASGSYTIQHADRERLLTYSGSGPASWAVPQAIGAFGRGWRCWIQNKGAGTVTITPTTSTINGASSLAVIANRGIVLWSDGKNWQIEGDLN
jgi:hypothetical protein